MSDPRMIPKDAAKRQKSHIEAVGMTGGSKYRHWWTIAALHEQVERQAARIAQLDTELDAVASHSLAQGRKLRRQATQIERVREVLAWAEQAENRAHADWIRTADTHHRDTALAYTQAVTWLRYALGDTDD